jgi:hypothetical protein
LWSAFQECSIIFSKTYHGFFWPSSIRSGRSQLRAIICVNQQFKYILKKGQDLFVRVLGCIRKK